MSKWPASTPLHSFSFVQDLPPQIFSEGIAQPIILFRFWCLTSLATSQLGRNLKHFRLRIPLRNLLPALTPKNDVTVPIAPTRTDFRLPLAFFTSLTYLDLSTSCFNHHGLGAILRSYPTLQHLILDRTQIIVPSRYEGDEERVSDTLRAMGTFAASVGLSRSLDASRLWRDFSKTITDENKQRKASGSSTRPQDTFIPSSSPGSVSRRPPRPKKPGRSAFASGPRSQLLPVSAPSNSSSTSVPERMGDRIQSGVPEEIILPSKAVIVPSAPTLKSLSCGTPLNIPQAAEIRAQWASHFLEGWKSGLERYEIGVMEKLAEWERNLELWSRSLAVDKDPDAFVNTKPRLMRFGVPKTVLADDPVEAFFDALGLVDTVVEEVLESLQLSLTAPVFCSVPDCPASGRVVWKASSNSPEGPVDLIRLGKRLQAVNLHDQDEVTKPDDGQEEVLEFDVAAHEKGCGHMIGRDIWDSDYW